MSSKDRPLLHGGEVTAYDMIRSVKWEAHRGLLNSVPTMLRHLREDGISDPSLFLRRDPALEFLAGDLLRSFFNNLNKNQEMSVHKTREICAWRTPHVLACAISNVLEFSAQPLIPSETSLRLLAIASGLRPSPRDKRIEMVSDVLEEMPAWRFEILASFICFLRDCNSPNPDLAREIGPLMLLRDGVSLAPPPSRGRKVPDVVREQNQINDEMAASDAFRVMIDDCGPIFCLANPYHPPGPPRPLAAHHSGSGAWNEEKSIIDEEKTSNPSLTNLYEGMSAEPMVPKRRQSKKASTFYNIIARTASNLSRDSNESGSPVSILKPNSSAAVGGSSRRMESLPTVRETAGTPPPQKPAKPGSMMESNGWQDKRPPPVWVGASSQMPSKVSPQSATMFGRGNFAVDSPLIQSQNSFSSTSGRPNLPAIRTQTSNLSNNPMIKTQTSFNSSNRPSTPTAMLSAKKNVLADIQAGNGSGLLRSSSPTPSEVRTPLDTVPENFVGQKRFQEQEEQRILEERRQQHVLEQQQRQQQEQRRQEEEQRRSQEEEQRRRQEEERRIEEEQKTPVRESRFSVLSTSSYKSPKMEEQGFPVFVGMSSATTQDPEMNADGPTIFEREMVANGAIRPRAVAANGAPPNRFDEELRRRTQTSLSQTKVVEGPVEEKAEEPSAVTVAEVPPAKPPKPPKPAKRPNEPRHSFIPRITSPRRSLEGGSKQGNAFDDAASDSEDNKKESDTEEDGEATPTPVSPLPKGSFADQLARRRSQIESSGAAVESNVSPLKETKAQQTGSFDEQLARRRSQVESNGRVVEQPTTTTHQTLEASSPKPSSQGKTFQEILAERKSQSEGGDTSPVKHRPSLEPNRLTPPFQPRPKPVRPSLTFLPPVDPSPRNGSIALVPVSASPPPNAGSPEPTMEDKLANLRALLKHNSGDLSEDAPAPSPPPEDTKKRVPPPDQPPPPGHPRMEREGGVLIIGDWRSEYSPQYKAQFWVNILTGARQWAHPNRERSKSTKEREAQRAQFKSENTSVTYLVPEPGTPVEPKDQPAKKPMPKKPTPPPLVAKVTATAKVESPQVKHTLASIGRQSSSEVQKQMHQGYRRASIQSEDFQAQQSAQFDESDEFVIAAARAAGESIAECIFDFTPLDPNNKAELAIRTGEKLRIYEMGTDGWWGGVKIRDGRQRGLFPEGYVKLI